MHRLPTAALALLCAVSSLAAPAAASAQSRRVAVVVMEGKGYPTRARVGIALRNELTSKGRLVTNPADVFDRRSATLSQLSAARAKFTAGVGQYDGLSFSKARAELERAVELFREVLARGGDVKDYLKALHYLGAAALYDNDRLKALAHFAEAAVFAPAVRPDESIFSPDVLKAFDDAKTAGAANCTVNVLSTPSAEVKINGTTRGVSKLTLSDLRPGRYLVRFERAGYEADAQWISVEEGASAEVRTELKSLPQLTLYRQTLTEVGQELGAPTPGAAVQRLMKMLSVSSVIVVSSVGRAVVGAWAEGGQWVKRQQGTVAQGGEGAFSARLIATTGIVPPPAGGCRSAASCAAGQLCQRGVCVASVTSTPIYKKWWFWTIIGAAVAGGTVGVILGTRDTTEDWTLVLKPGDVQ